jgi:multisubunit Na+/H+ antiporter MnhF subunit
MIGVATTVALVILAICILICLYRAIVGPSLADRVIALDATTINGMAIMVVIGIKYRTALYLDVALIVAILSFVGTVAIAKFLMRGRIIE